MFKSCDHCVVCLLPTLAFLRFNLPLKNHKSGIHLWRLYIYLNTVSQTCVCHRAFFCQYSKIQLKISHRLFVEGTRAMLSSWLAYKNMSSLLEPYVEHYSYVMMHDGIKIEVWRIQILLSLHKSCNIIVLKMQRSKKKNKSKRTAFKSIRLNIYLKYKEYRYSFVFFFSWFHFRTVHILLLDCNYLCIISLLLQLVKGNLF